MVPIRGSNPGSRGISRTRPDRPQGPSSLLYKKHWAFPGGKGLERGTDHPLPASTGLRMGRCYTSVSHL